VAEASAAAIALPLAHFGHWWGSLLFAVPVVVLFLVVAWDNLKRRWRDRQTKGRS
jgi:membrane protein implicated in regulation of membrane protease activity